MSSVDAQEMRQIEQAAFRRGVDPGQLMDQAGIGIAARLIHHFPQPGTAIAYIGKGNNGGDALVVLDHLRAAGWQIVLRASHREAEWSTLSRQRLRRLTIQPAAALPDLRLRPRPLLLLDALLGIGARGPLRDPLLPLAREIDNLRQNHGAQVAAIDLPSGLCATTGQLHPGGVCADLTLTIGIPKCGLLQDRASASCGALFLVPLPDLPIPDRPGIRLASPDTFPGLLPPRPHDFHKGDAGRLSILAGSPGLSGAATLCASAALRAGAGLVQLHLDIQTQVATPPEIMVSHRAERLPSFFSARADALVIGPGLGQNDPALATALIKHLANNSLPTVLDADALNLLAAAKRLDLLGPHHLITPHPGEFARLAPDLAPLSRADAASRFVDRHPCTLLLKGSRSLIATPGQALRLNPTGHAGMACGGQGDALAGTCGALLACGTSLPDAAMLAAWLCGRAAERALSSAHESHESTTASDTIAQLGPAFSDWRNRSR